MGKSESKLGGVTHEEAVRKGTSCTAFFCIANLVSGTICQLTVLVCLLIASVTEDELSRLHSAFKRSSHAGYMNKAYFVRDMLTDVVPVQLGNVS